MYLNINTIRNFIGFSGFLTLYNTICNQSDWLTFIL